MNFESIIHKEAGDSLRQVGTGSQGIVPSVRATQESRNPKSMTRKPIRCDSDHCGLPAICSLEFRFFCVGHFISYCYERLDQCPKGLTVDAGEDDSKSVDRFLQECSQQAASLVDPARGLDNLERARLFDIFLWASELAAKRTVFAEREVIDSAYRFSRRES